MDDRKALDLEPMDATMVSILRSKSGAERLQIAFGLWELAKDIIWCSERRRHPDLDEEALGRLVAERMSRAAE